MKREGITYYKSEELGKGLPYAITPYHRLRQSDDIFTPSLRDFHAVFYIRKGSGSYVVDFKEYSFEEGMLILLSKDQLHHFNAFDKDQTDILSVVFNPDFFYRTESDLQHLFQFVSTSHTMGEQILHVHSEADSRLNKLFEQMEWAYDSLDEVYQAKAFYHLLGMFLIECEMLKDAQKQHAKEVSDDHLKTSVRLRELLEQHYKTAFKVEFYAEQLAIPLKTLSRISQSYFKLSPKALINERRLLEIKRLLKGTKLSGKEIAYELNFDEPTNMYKFFRKHVGMTINDFRSSGS